MGSSTHIGPALTATALTATALIRPGLARPAPAGLALLIAVQRRRRPNPALDPSTIAPGGRAGPTIAPG
nr:hypothetical protein [Actinomycetota bacterium]